MNLAVGFFRVIANSTKKSGREFITESLMVSTIVLRYCHRVLVLIKY